MYTERHSIPISISVSASDVADGTIIVEGLVSFADQTLVLELQKTDNRMSKSDAVRHEFPIRDIQIVEFKRRPVGSIILIEMISLDALSGLPGSARNRMKLNVARKYRDRVADLVTHVQIELSELRLAEM